MAKTLYLERESCFGKAKGSAPRRPGRLPPHLGWASISKAFSSAADRDKSNHADRLPHSAKSRRRTNSTRRMMGRGGRCATTPSCLDHHRTCLSPLVMDMVDFLSPQPSTCLPGRRLTMVPGTQVDPVRGRLSPSVTICHRGGKAPPMTAIAPGTPPFPPKQGQCPRSTAVAPGDDQSGVAAESTLVGRGSTPSAPDWACSANSASLRVASTTSARNGATGNYLHTYGYREESHHEPVLDEAPAGEGYWWAAGRGWGTQWVD